MTNNPAHLQAWTDFHQCVNQLPDRERQVFELLWYHELKQEEAAEMMKCRPETSSGFGEVRG